MSKQNLIDLAGHKAVITGASSGIGKEYARQLAARGADLVIAARRITQLEELAAELQKSYSISVQCIQIDLTTDFAAQTVFQESTRDQKPVTILINCAGIGKYGKFIDFSLGEHQAIFKLNAVVPTELTYLILKHMMQHGKPSYITQVASIAAFQPVGNFTVYSGTKAYLRYFSETLAYELKGTHVGMTCLCPGGTYTEFFAHSGQKITKSGHLTMMSCERVVKIGLKAMLQRKTVCVPGILNKLSCFLPRLFPRNLALILAEKTMNRAVEKIPQASAITPETRVTTVISDG